MSHAYECVDTVSSQANTVVDTTDFLQQLAISSRPGNKHAAQKLTITHGCHQRRAIDTMMQANV